MYCTTCRISKYLSQLPMSSPERMHLRIHNKELGESAESFYSSRLQPPSFIYPIPADVVNR